MNISNPSVVPSPWRRPDGIIGSLLLLLGVAAPLNADTWQRLPDVPGARTSHSAIWTGTEVILWGGGIDGQFLNTGARLSPTTGNWQVTSVSNAPSPRWFHGAVWTGTEMYIWGGRASFSTDSHAPLGARYSPRTDRWTPLPTQGAPTPRSQFAAVWTGTEFIVWGGVTDNGVLLNDGARFNPTNNTWRPLSPSGLEPRMEPSYVWTGSELIVHGGLSFAGGGLTFASGARYQPRTDTWIPLPAADGPGSRAEHTLVWTGSKVIAWGGRTLPGGQTLNTGAAFDPVANAWNPLPVAQAPGARMLHAAVWTGSEMILWGGQADAAGTLLNTGGRYHPQLNSWTPTTLVNGPGRRMFWRPDLGLWTGSRMVIAAGSDYPASLASAYLYDPAGTNAPPPSTNTTCVAAPEGLAAWWPWNGSALDRVTGAEARLSGGPVFDNGRVGQGLRFDGANDEALVDASPALRLGEGTGFSIETWVKPSHVTMQPLVEWLPGPGAAGVHFWIGVYGSGSIFANLVDTGNISHSWRSDTGIVTSNEWQHLAMTYDRGSGVLRLYRNGLKASEQYVGTFVPQTQGPLAIGHRPGQEHFAGSLDEVSLYRRALSDAEIAALHAAGAGKCGAEPPPIAPAYDLSADFTLASNPSGPWSYGRLPTLTSPLELLPLQRTFGAENGVPIGLWYNEPVHKPFVAKVLGPGTAVSTYFTAPAGTVYFGANPFTAQPEFAAIRFTLPANAGGTYRLETSVRALFDSVRSADADFHVLRNGTELFERLVPANGTGAYTNVLVLQPGDRIDFAAGRGSGNDNTGLKIQATLTRLTNAPPPPPPPPETNCAPAPSGLAAWWPAERNPNDIAGTHRGVLLGNAGYAPGPVGTAFSLPGDDSGIQIPASPALDVGAGPGLTIEGWIRPDDLSVRSPLVEWNRGGPGVVTWGLHLYILMPQEFGLGAGNLVANLTDLAGASHFVTAPGGTIAANVWQHIALTYDRASGFARLYCQGKLVGEAALGSFTPDTRPDLYLGRRPAGDGALSYRGRLDELSIYRRALNAAEIASIATAGAAGKCRVPSSLDDLVALVSGLSPELDAQPLLSSLASVRAAIERGNLRSAIHQLGAFQNKARAQLGAVRPDLSAQVIAQAQLLIETLDPTGARRADLLALAGRPMRIERILRDGSRARLLGFAPPGIACCIQGSPDLRNWQHAGWADEIDDGVFEWLDDGATPEVRFFRLLEP